MYHKTKNQIKQSLKNLKCSVKPEGRDELKLLNRLFGQLRQDYSKLKVDANAATEAKNSLSEKLSCEQKRIAELETDMAKSKRAAESKASNARSEIERMQEMLRFAMGFMSHQVHSSIGWRLPDITSSDKLLELLENDEFQQLKITVAAHECFADFNYGSSERLKLYARGFVFLFLPNGDEFGIVAMTEDEVEWLGDDLEDYVEEIVSR